jgi:tetrapyrrole methylase family protein / MazG family protein
MIQPDRQDDSNIGHEFIRLIEIMRQLRSPEGGCPWDRQQTHESLQPYLTEETYEVLDSIDRGAYAELEKELGDLLLHIVFHAQLGAEENLFTIQSVIECINEKLIRRHPHVFGDATVETTDDVNRQWEKIKLQEKHKPKLLEGVPIHQPALNRAFRVQEKAAAVGFDWPDAQPVWKKIDEEILELKHEVKHGDAKTIEAEFGDLLFSMVNLGRKLGVHPEEALRQTIDKFSKRFRYIEDSLEQAGIKIQDSSLQEMDKLWEASKQKSDNH